MTTVIALRLNKKIVFASESAVTNSGRVWIQKEGKFFKADNGIVIGYSGSVREEQIVRYGLSIPVLQHAEEVEHYMYRLANAIKAAFLERNSNKDDDNCKSSFIVCYQGRLFHFDADFQIMEFVGDFEAIGSGQYYAIGAMSALIEAGETDPVKIATKAIEAAIKYDPWSVGPVHTIEVECPVGTELT